MKPQPPSIKLQFLASRKGDVHTVPVYRNELKHEPTSKCFCNPEPYFVDLVTGKASWLHKRPS